MYYCVRMPVLVNDNADYTVAMIDRHDDHWHNCSECGGNNGGDGNYNGGCCHCQNDGGGGK